MPHGDGLLTYYLNLALFALFLLLLLSQSHLWSFLALVSSIHRLLIFIFFYILIIIINFLLHKTYILAFMPVFSGIATGSGHLGPRYGDLSGRKTRRKWWRLIVCII
jgi:small-conductance mechanosensitive channel